MLELYQFELSHYSEKVRLILDYKGLAYRQIEVTPGIGQIDLYRLSGQRLVPVLKDGNQVIADSTAIALYLEQKYPDRPILPSDAQQRALCLVMEEWADASIGLESRKALLGAASQSQSFRTALLPDTTPSLVRNLVEAVPGEFLSAVGFGVGFGPDAVKSAHTTLKQNLEALSILLTDHPYLITDHPTLADFAVAGLSMYIKFPDGPYLNLPASLKGKGIPGLADQITYKPFFDWRDRLYADYRQPPLSGPTNPGTAPTSIQIE